MGYIKAGPNENVCCYAVAQLKRKQQQAKARGTCEMNLPGKSEKRRKFGGLLQRTVPPDSREINFFMQPRV